MGGLLTVPAFLERFPQVDIVNSSSFHGAWVTGTLFETKNTLRSKMHPLLHILT
jgi:hypothetical protein